MSVLIHSERGLIGLIKNKKYIELSQKLNFLLANRTRKVDFKNHVKPIEDLDEKFDGLQMIIDDNKAIKYPAPFDYRVMQGIVNNKMYVFDFVQPYPPFIHVDTKEHKLVALKLGDLILPFPLFPEAPLSKPEALDGLQSIAWRILSGEFGTTVEEVKDFVSKNITFDQNIDTRPATITTFVDDIFSTQHESPFIPGLVYAEIKAPHNISARSLDGGTLLGYFDSSNNKLDIDMAEITDEVKKYFITSTGNKHKIFVINPTKFNLIEQYLK